MDDALLLHEELLLLGLKDDKGSVAIDRRTNYAIAGGVLVELALRGAIDFDEETYVVVNATPGLAPVPSEDLLAECFAEISKGEPLPAMALVPRLAAKKHVRHRVAEPLVQRGVLDKRRKVLGIRYPTLDGRPEAELTERLSKALLSDAGEVAPRTAAAVAIGRAAHVLRNNFDKKMLKQRSSRIDQLANASQAISCVSSAVKFNREDAGSSNDLGYDC